MDWFEKLTSWSKMPPRQKLNVLIGAIVIVLCSIIIHYERKEAKTREENRNIIASIVTRRDAREAALEAKVEICNQSYLQYLQKSEKEYRDLLFEAKKLKEKINENEDI